jgi:DNA-nicking Smr family endonuclease
MAEGPPGSGTKETGRRRKTASRSELELWQSAMRDVRPLRRRAPRKVATAAAEPPVAAAPEASPPGLSRERAPNLAVPKIGGHAAPDLDKSTAAKLKRGRQTIERRIDLHGMTQDEAHRALIGFIGRAAEDGMRCVLVITGKGLRKLADEGQPGDLGVLRHAVPRWLNEPPTRARILAYGPAQPRHGGGGALYVLLRRRR